MAQESVTVDPSVADLRQQMVETRTHLAGQVEVLEHEVMDMVHDATSAVAGTIESVRDTVGETVETVQEVVKGTMTSVKHTFDVSAHVRQHPWLMLAGAVAFGYVCGTFLLRRQ